MKLAIVHDFLLSYGGAERVLEHVHEMYPEAPVYVLRYDAKRMHHRMDGWDIRTSFVERLPMLKRRGHTLAMPFYPTAMEQFDLKQYDVVLSLSSMFAHGVITQPETKHICYYHTPARMLWDYHFQYLAERGWDKGMKGMAVKNFMHRLRQWDFVAAKRPDMVIANSQTVADRIRKFYRRDAQVIFPGVDMSGIEPSTHHEDYYLVISRITRPKRIELAVQACTKLNRPLHIVGSGEDVERLKSMAGPSIKFLGFLSDDDLQKELAHCRALLWPGIDDFGLVPVEAMAYGRPVVAYNKGGATETVLRGQTGILFNEHSTDGLIKAILELDTIEARLDPQFIHHHSSQFSKEQFQQKIRKVIER